MIYLTIEGQEMAGILTAPLVAGQVNFVEVKTIFDSTWDDLNKSYQFRNGDHVNEVDSNDEIISLPYEATAESGTLEINVVGTKLDDDGVSVLKKATTNTLRFKVGCCNLADDPDNCGEVSATVVEQIRQIAETAEDKATEAERISAVIWAAYESGELKGKDGRDGRDGKNGVDGVSPTFETKQVEGGAEITLNDVNGSQVVMLENGPRGEQGPRGETGPRGERGLTGNSGANGKDGVSPTVTTTQTSTGAKITIKDATGTHTAELLNGKDGKDGADGKDGTMSFEDLTEAQKATLKGDSGKDGADGYSPSAKVSQTSTGATITITDKNGTTTANVVNGKDGVDGKDGATGPAGENGITPHIGKNGNWWIGETDTGISPSGGGSSGGDCAPIGNIISFMGTIAPNGYLTCDGAVLNIVDYPRLASHFETQFGSKSYFGGDGSTTFAVPDLRNEFLRGYHGEAELQLSGEIGIHQDATEHKVFLLNNGTLYGYTHTPTASDQANNVDTRINAQTNATSNYVKGSVSNSTAGTHYTARPTNVAVLYCIKY